MISGPIQPENFVKQLIFMIWLQFGLICFLVFYIIKRCK